MKDFAGLRTCLSGKQKILPGMFLHRGKNIVAFCLLENLNEKLMSFGLLISCVYVYYRAGSKTSYSEYDKARLIESPHAPS